MRTLPRVDTPPRPKYNLSMTCSPIPGGCIRPHKRRDLARLHEIDQICFAPDIAYTRSELLFYLNHPGSITLVAEQDGRIVGFSLGRLLPDRTAHVLTLDVLPEARRRRLGTLLMRSLHDEFKRMGVRRVVLEVSAENLAARRLYEGLQYSFVETVQGYYNGREDAHRMVLVM